MKRRPRSARSSRLQTTHYVRQGRFHNRRVAIITVLLAIVAAAWLYWDNAQPKDPQPEKLTKVALIEPPPAESATQPTPAAPADEPKATRPAPRARSPRARPDLPTARAHTEELYAPPEPTTDAYAPPAPPAPVPVFGSAASNDTGYGGAANAATPLPPAPPPMVTPGPAGARPATKASKPVQASRTLKPVAKSTSKPAVRKLPKRASKKIEPVWVDPQPNEVIVGSGETTYHEINAKPSN